MLHHLFVNISLCISKRDCSCLKCNYNSIISPEKLTIMLPHRAPRTCWNCHDTLLFTICLNKDYALQVSLDYCVIQQGWVVPLWWASHCPEFCLSVFRWWFPLPYPPVCWDFLKQHMGFCSGPAVILLIMTALLRSCDSQMSGRNCH